MEKHLTRLFAFAVVFIFSAVGNAQEPKVSSMPAVSIPEAAAAEGLYGTMLVEVKLDDAGKVKNIKQIVGPDWTCPNYESPGMTALNDYVRNRAQTATIDSGGKSHLWLEFKFVDPRPKGSFSTGKIISGGVVNGKAIHLELPVYPESARAMQVNGRIAIKVLISENGKVISAENMSGESLLANPSRVAACRSQFSPVLLQGKPVKVTGMILYSFNP